MRRRAVIAICLCGSLAGWSLAPSYKTPPSVPAPADYKELGDWKPAHPADGESRGPWWQSFNNAELDILEVKVDAANQDLKAALARLQQARAQTRIARAGYFPSVVLNSTGTRARGSANSP